MSYRLIPTALSDGVRLYVQYIWYWYSQITLPSSTSSPPPLIMGDLLVIPAIVKFASWTTGTTTHHWVSQNTVLTLLMSHYIIQGFNITILAMLTL